MLTKERTSKARKIKYVAVALALLAVLVFCFASCGKATPTGIEYVTGTAAKIEYNQGEIFDCTGAQIKVTYDNGAVETKNVTAEMVGNAPLSLGATTVSVTYSENGATVVGYIPVTVKDPYAADKATAVAGLNDNASVKANSTDKGVSALVLDYTAKINAATSKDAITALVGNFEDALSSYLTKKEAVLAELDAVSLDGLYKQFLLQVQSLKSVTESSIKTASSIEEANDFLAAFKTAVANALKEQEVYEGDSESDGMIEDKISILTDINYYVAKTNTYKGYIEAALAANEITATKRDAKIADYNNALTKLEWWYEYITLAINLEGKLAQIEAEVLPLIHTPVDDVADKLAAGVTVYPTPYKFDEATGTYVDDTANDETAKLIAELNGYINQSNTEYGATMTNKLLTEYGRFGEIDLTEIIDDINDKYVELNGIRSDARTPDDVIALIEAAYNAAEGTAKADAVAKAWAALKAWGTNKVFSEAAGITIDNNLVFDKTYDGQYSVVLENNKWTTDAGSWSNKIDEDTVYEVNKDYVVKYYVPNIDKLVEATIAQAAFEVKEAAIAIGDVIFPYDVRLPDGVTAIDANPRITAAEAALAAFVADYGAEEFAARGLDVTQEEVDAARYQYDEVLKKLAKAANDAIKAYLTSQSYIDNGVVRSDYESGEGLLNAAYVAYCAFATENTDSNGVIYTDVIDYSDATTKSNNETNLIACMDQYVALAYAEERHVQADLIINEAYLKRLNGTDELEGIPTDETIFRTKLQEYKQGEIDKLSTDPAYDYKTAFDKDGDGVIDLEKTNFNYEAVRDANIDAVKAVANQIATGILGVTFNGTDLVFPTVAP